MSKERLLKIILSPHVTNKAYAVTDNKPYAVFKVLPDATKFEIKSAVELLFDVKVDSVNTVKNKGKSRIFKGIKGKVKSSKKAYVRLQKGHDINFVGAE